MLGPNAVCTAAGMECQCHVVSAPNRNVHSSTVLKSSNTITDNGLSCYVSMARCYAKLPLCISFCVVPLVTYTLLSSSITCIVIAISSFIFVNKLWGYSKKVTESNCSPPLLCIVQFILADPRLVEIFGNMTISLCTGAANFFLLFQIHT